MTTVPQLSQSALSAFTRCRRRFYLRFHRRLEWPAPLTGSEQEWERSLRRGERFHLLVQQHALGMAADDIVRAARDEELSSWWDRLQRHPPPVADGFVTRTHTELELEVPLSADRRLVARFDRLVVTEASDGVRIDIVDWKTGAGSTREQLERSWQTTVYRFVALEGAASLTRGDVAPRAESVRFVYWQTAIPETPVVLTYTEAEHERGRERIEAAVSDIDKRLAEGESAFPRTDDTVACQHCPYRSYCERGREAGPESEFEADDEGEADGWLAPPDDPEVA